MQEEEIERKNEPEEKLSGLAFKASVCASSGYGVDGHS